MTTAATTPDPPPAGSRRLVWWGLAASLAVNFMVAGAVVGAWLDHRHDRHDRHGHRGPLGAVVRFSETLPSDRAAVISVKVKETREALRDSRKTVRDARRRAREALRAEPFDAAAFRAAMDEMVALRSSARQTASDAFVEAVIAMTAEERKAFGRWLDQRRRGKRGERGD